MDQITRFVGLDVHKRSIVVAVAAAADTGKAAHHGTITNTPDALERLVQRLRETGPGPLSFCYEAGPCGYGVHRTLTRLDQQNMVVAPSLIPRKSGERRKTDKRDAANLAVLLRSGLLTAARVPDAAHEAMRDLIRARQAAVRALRAVRQQTGGFLLRHERIYPEGRTTWTRAHRNWLAGQRFAEPAHYIVLEEYIAAERQAQQRLQRAEQHVREQIPSWRLATLVRNLCALRGIDVIAAAGIAAAIGDPARFASAAEFMAYLGLVPSEASSGERRRLGAITKTGDNHARFLLVEAAHTYRHPARVARGKLDAVEAVADAVRTIAWKAQTRLCKRFKAMLARGKPKGIVAVAIARERAGFVWAIACITSDPPTDTPETAK